MADGVEVKPGDRVKVTEGEHAGEYVAGLAPDLRCKCNALASVLFKDAPLCTTHLRKGFEATGTAVVARLVRNGLLRPLLSPIGDRCVILRDIEPPLSTILHIPDTALGGHGQHVKEVQHEGQKKNVAHTARGLVLACGPGTPAQKWNPHATPPQWDILDRIVPMKSTPGMRVVFMVKHEETSVEGWRGLTIIHDDSDVFAEDVAQETGT